VRDRREDKVEAHKVTGAVVKTRARVRFSCARTNRFDVKRLPMRLGRWPPRG
jgi:hypothetical protein